MATFVNLTPHDVNIIMEDGSVLTVERSGTVARCAVTQKDLGKIDNIPFFRTTFGEVQDLPDPQFDVIYIVSMLVRQALPNRHDVASPGEVVRNEAGQPIGCKGLVLN